MSGEPIGLVAEALDEAQKQQVTVPEGVLKGGYDRILSLFEKRVLMPKDPSTTDGDGL